jgi:hypothetical protein
LVISVSFKWCFLSPSLLLFTFFLQLIYSVYYFNHPMLVTWPLTFKKSCSTKITMSTVPFLNTHFQSFQYISCNSSSTEQSPITYFSVHFFYSSLLFLCHVLFMASGDNTTCKTLNNFSALFSHPTSNLALQDFQSYSCQYHWESTIMTTLLSLSPWH